MEDPEFDLIRAIGEGDEAAFEQLVRRYQDPVVSFIYRHMGDRYAAQDFAQEVFLRVFQTARRFEPRGKVSTWVFRIAYNLSANEIKRRRRMAGFHAEMLAGGTELSERSLSNHVGMKEEELEEQLLTALGQLPENQRAALLLRVKDGLSYVEISKVLGVSVGSVESLIFRARKRMKGLVKD
jgi:RNA polymerase sigma-70 factor, ECF subfamily